MFKWGGNEREARTPRNPAKSIEGAAASMPKIPEPTSIVKGEGFEGWIETWPMGPIVIVKSQCFHLGICFLDRQRAKEFQRVLIPIIEVLEATK